MIYSNLDQKGVEKLALKIAKKVANSKAIIGLSGNLGSGKTTFAKAFAKTLGIKSLKSPTFIVSQRYTLKNSFLYHMDFYRLEDTKQLVPLGLDEILSGQDIVLIEWIDKFPQIAAKCDILINLHVSANNKRNVTVKYPNSK